jgi:glutathione S-transferase
MQSLQNTTLYCAWFCPFAQRAWIALNEKQVKYDYVECVLYEGSASTKVSLTVDAKRLLNPAFVKASPRGLVPALYDPNREALIHESLVCMYYADEAYPTAKQPPAGVVDPSFTGNLMPADPAAKAHIRTAIGYFDDKVRPFFYAMLMRQDDAGRAAAMVRAPCTHQKSAHALTHTHTHR